jgi:hypothetical protein
MKLYVLRPEELRRIQNTQVMNNHNLSTREHRPTVGWGDKHTVSRKRQGHLLPKMTKPDALDKTRRRTDLDTRMKFAQPTEQSFSVPLDSATRLRERAPIEVQNHS